MIEPINTPDAPQPIGPYNQAIKAGDFLFVSGQIAINPETNKLVVGDITVEARMVFENISQILNKAGLTFSNVVKSTIFLKDMSTFPIVNEIYSEYFKQPYPTRETVEVARLPKGVNIEVSVIAYCK
ncbi:endoribonuclease [Thermaurantimonas aggregans]|uniref:Endoribonuclease n=1 Tax=Thermaurantimonas aggregans TaxID=2173829 RepID=A0A401XK79_9FLAO|nr:RidA family protein [Thermaurantimonas aggregans]MCX8148505.1 RidA family protein [Thermaurantimonas aggregans]GCD77418.1 endoribonuclease [Thermaurantimonas aggregans]